MSVFGYKKIKARKQHKCWWCGEDILVGEVHDRWVWVEDKIKTVRAHNECGVAWNRSGGDEIMFGQEARGVQAW